MKPTSNRTRGAMIAIFAATGSVIFLTLGHLSPPIAVGLAVVGIVIGTGVARGAFSHTQDTTKKN